MCLEVLDPSLPAGVSPLVWQNLGNCFPFSGWFLKRKSWGCWIDVIPLFRHSVTSEDYEVHLHRAVVSTSVN